MKRVLHHIAVPACVPTVFFLVALTPVELLGCRNRGLIAALIALLGALAALATSALGAKRKMRGDPSATWWLASTLILIIPAVAILAIA